MSKADDFRLYAEEAIRWAYQSKTEKNKLMLLDIRLPLGAGSRMQLSVI